jgi:uncharacterized membrane protein YagU involved in acid resistance
MKPNWKRAMLGGFVGTLALTFMMYKGAPMMGFNKLDMAARLGQFLGTSWTAGLVMHFFIGTIVYALGYALLAYRFLPGPPVVKGMVWGVVLWLGLELVGMPMMGAGLFSMKAGGMRAAIPALVGHLVYGALLGGIAGAGVGAEPQERQVRRAA